MNWFSKLKQGLSKTASLFAFSSATADDFDSLEESLIRADVGYHTTTEILNTLRAQKPKDGAELHQMLSQILCHKMEAVAHPLEPDFAHKPFIILMTGVNGAGKTTTIGKLGSFFKSQGKQIAFVAADTFRAGATEQLCRWGDRLHCKTYTTSPGSDAAGLVFDAIRDSRQAGDDILFIDTAGRLQNRVDLMDELKKIKRIIQKKDATAPHATLLVLDATVGQNALSQVKIFQETIGISGLIMTKLDGTAKGGILIALADQFHLPIYALGVGESIDDLHSFTAHEYVKSLLGDE